MNLQVFGACDINSEEHETALVLFVYGEPRHHIFFVVNFIICHKLSSEMSTDQQNVQICTKRKPLQDC